MANIEIRDLEINEELDHQALENLTGGRWVLRTFYQRAARIGLHRVPQRSGQVNQEVMQSDSSVLQRFARLVWL